MLLCYRTYNGRAMISLGLRHDFTGTVPEYFAVDLYWIDCRVQSMHFQVRRGRICFLDHRGCVDGKLEKFCLMNLF